MIYRERVLPSAAKLVLPVLLFLSIFALMLPINSDLAVPAAIAVTLGFLLFIFFSSPTIEVTESMLRCKGAGIDKRFIGAVTVIHKSELFEELGQKLDARAWLSVQASVKGLVKLEIIDEEDNTPYWLISTRKPELLAAALKKS
jgi:hypothetical protein